MIFRVREIQTDLESKERTPAIVEKEANVVLCRGGIGFVGEELGNDGQPTGSGVVEIGVLPGTKVLTPENDFTVFMMEMMHPFPGTTIYLENEDEIDLEAENDILNKVFGPTETEN